MRYGIPAALLVALLTACGGVPPPNLDCRLLGCPAGQVCTLQEGGTYACEAAPPCEEAGCPDGEICENGACRPATCVDTGCPVGELCENGACRPDNCPFPHWPWCKDVGQKCSSEESPCKTNPSDDPYYCEEAIPCGEPLPQPQCPSFVNRGGGLSVQGAACDCWLGQDWKPCPTPPPPGECPDEVALVGTTCFEEEFRHEVKRATDTLGDLCGNFWKDNLDTLAVQLRKQMPGRCVISGVEAIFIERDDGKFEENHTVYSANGCWTNNGYGRYIGCHANVTPEPLACPTPHPDQSRARIDCGDHNGATDCTYKIVGQPGYCLSVGFPCMPGHGTERPCDPPNMIRGTCPMWGDGHPNRLACEKELAPPSWTCNGQPHYPGPNPWQDRRCRGHWKICAAGVCSEGDR